MNGNADGIGHPEEDSNCACPDCRSPADGPPAWLRDKAVSIWCGDYFTQLADELVKMRQRRAHSLSHPALRKGW